MTTKVEANHTDVTFEQFTDALGKGRYIPLEELGRGAMGQVLRAYDSRLGREVALKRVLPQQASREGMQRLAQEARAMAQLSCPNVVTVFDVEPLGDGTVVLVMEYVRGTTLRVWTRQRRRHWSEIIEMFTAAGRGLAAAHLAGVLHRDFKAANVLVTEDGRPKVTDFGLAKLVQASPQTISTPIAPAHVGVSITMAGTILGTPRNMAPEQHRGLPLSEAADQYAFCVSVWEALWDAPPFRGSCVEELESEKRKGPPATPAGDVPPTIARAIARGLAVDPGDRWPSMEALLGALEPKSRRRWRLPVLAAAGTAALAGLAIITDPTPPCTTSAIRLAGIWDDPSRTQIRSSILDTKLPYAPDTWLRTEATLDDYATRWVDMHTDACEATILHGTQPPQMMELRMACLERARTDMAAVTRELGRADRATLAQVGAVLSGLRPLEHCADTQALSAEVAPPSAEDERPVAEIRQSIAAANAARKAGRLAAAQSHIDDALTALAKTSYGPVATETQFAEAEVLAEQGDWTTAATRMRDVLLLAVQWWQVHYIREAAFQLTYYVGIRGHRLEEGRNYLALASALSSGSEDLGGVEYCLGLLSDEEGESVQAEGHYRQALAHYREAYGTSHPETAKAHSGIALSLVAQGRIDEAVVEMRQTVAETEELHGPLHPFSGVAALNMGAILADRGDLAQAEQQYRRALEILELAYGPEDMRTTIALGNLAIALTKQSRFDEAEPLHRRTLEIRTRTLGADHPSTATSMQNLADHLVRVGELDEAEPLMRRALKIREAVLDPGHPHLAYSQHHLARLLLDRGDAEGALEMAQRAWERRRRDDVPAQDRAETASLLVRAQRAAAEQKKDRGHGRGVHAERVDD